MGIIFARVKQELTKRNLGKNFAKKALIGTKPGKVKNGMWASSGEG